MSKRMPTYTYVEKNIYKTGKKYRVRVAEFSGYADTKVEAKKLRTLLRFSAKGDKIFN